MSRSRLLALLMILFLGAAGSFYAFHAITAQAEAVGRLRMLSAVDAFTSDFREYIRAQGLVANSFAALLTVAPATTQAEFEAFGARVSPSYPSVVAVNWFPRTPPAEFAHVEEALVAAGALQPFVRDASGAPLRADGLRRDAFPVLMTTPLEVNRGVLGFDVASSAARRPALEQARDSGEMVSSEPVKLVQLPGVRGTNLYAPVYRAGADTSTGAARRQALAGYISAAFRLDLLAHDASSEAPTLFRAHLFDAEAPPGQRHLATMAPAGEDGTAPGEDILGRPELESRAVKWGHRDWTLVFEPLPEGLGGARPQASLVLAAGLVMTMGLVSYLANLDRVRRQMRAANHALAAADRRKSELLAQWNALLENAPVGFAFFDRDLRYRQVNRTLAEINGLAVQDHVGRRVAEVMPGNAKGLEDQIAAVFATGRTVRGVEIKGETASRPGEVRYWLTGWFPVVVGGEVVSAGAVVHEITARKQAEAALQAAKDEAERANLAKSKFLAAASHDLRQPLQSLFFFSAALSTMIRDPKGRNALSMLDTGLETLKTLLDSLLDVSRLDAGVVQPAPEPFALSPWLAHLRDSYEPVARSKGLEFHVHGGCDAWVHSDRNLLGRMVRNLIENAIRYTPHGFVRVDCHPGAERIDIEVSDSGIGIPPDHLERIWEEFHQVGNHGRDRAQGLGLGLAIVRRLSRLLDHPVEVSSAPGRGTSFRLSVPVAEPVLERAARAG